MKIDPPECGCIDECEHKPDCVFERNYDGAGCGGEVKACTSDVPCAFGALAQIENLRAQLASAHKDRVALWQAINGHGPRCRDCADFHGRCQGDGPPCDPQARAMQEAAKIKDRLASARKVVDAARAYYLCAVQDEADDLECCCTENQHELAKALRDALTDEKGNS